jgi:hypothetical protein
MGTHETVGAIATRLEDALSLGKAADVARRNSPGLLGGFPTLGLVFEASRFLLLVAVSVLGLVCAEPVAVSVDVDHY